MKHEINPNSSGVTWQVPLKYLIAVHHEWSWSFPGFIYGFGLIIGYLGVTDKESLMYMASQQPSGMVLIGLIFASCLMGFLDMIANWNDKDRIVSLKEHRHFNLWLLSFCFLAMLFVGSEFVRSDGILALYIWPGVFTMAYSVTDARRRGKEKCAESS